MTGELGGSTTYLYWSERRVQKIISDNGIKIPASAVKITSPSFSGFAPTVEYSVNGNSALRSNVANAVERALGQTIVSRFDGEPGARYARGVGTVVFGEFIHDFQKHENDEDLRSLMFASCDYSESDKGSVAICLFGSMDNFADYVKASSASSVTGWTSSAAPSIMNFLTGKWADAVDEPSREEIAIEALKVADSQGIYSPHSQPPLKGWRRAFTYGDIQDTAEWLAGVYLDVDLPLSGMSRVDGFRRIIVGAPVWIRTPRLRSIRLYGEYTKAELEGKLGAAVNGNPANSRLHVMASRVIQKLRKV